MSKTSTLNIELLNKATEKLKRANSARERRMSAQQKKYKQELDDFFDGK
jgi:hypothetical protein